MIAPLLLVVLAAMSCPASSATPTESEPDSGETPSSLGPTTETGPRVIQVAWPIAEPLRVPCHPKVTTTVLFPTAPEPPDGAGFTQDPTNTPGMYRVSWQAGDRHLSVAPLPGATSRNLNVPCRGRIAVLVFQPVADPTLACALIEFLVSEERPPSERTSPQVTRSKARRASPYHAVTPARLVGMLDRLKLVHAAGDGGDNLLLAMRGISWAHPTRTTECGPLRIEPILCVRDERLDLLGFSCVIMNTTNEAVQVDVSSLGARAGAGFHRAATADGPSTLPPGGAAAAFFVVHGTSEGSPGHLSPDNDWILSLATEEGRALSK